MNSSLIMIGSGGHAKVLVEILQRQNIQIEGIITPDKELESKVFANIPVLGDDSIFDQLNHKNCIIINGIGSVPGNKLRFEKYKQLKELNYKFSTVLSKEAIISDYSNIEEGVQVMNGSIIQSDVSIGANSIINTGSIIEHDCVIGRHNHIAPGVALSGNVKTGDHVHIGTGASIIQGIDIASGSVIGAGANITRNVKEKEVVLPPQSKSKP